MRIIEFKIEQDNNEKAIRDFLRDFGVSSSLLTKLKNTDNGILLNGEFAKTIERLHTGDRLTIKLSNSGKMPARYESDKAFVEYEDEDILVLNKPAFMPVHESRNHQGDTLANVASCYMESDNAFRAVYRLDRDTSGLVLIAKNELAASKLSGKIEKDYYAVCKGILTGEGTIDLPIRREQESIIKRGVFPNGERAVTHWQAVKSVRDNTLLKIKLETGRTHQIRVHFSYIGHPLVGDSLYFEASDEISRQALHCKAIRFIHPISLKKVTVDSDFPDDFKRLID